MMHILETSTPDFVLAASQIGTGAYAGRKIFQGEKFAPITGAISDQPTRMSIQIGPSQHIQPGDAAWQYSNHSCVPNLGIDFSEWRFVALRDIAAGEELSWNYLITERHLCSPFQCRCGWATCLRLIAGFDALEPAQKMLIGDVAPHLQARQAASVGSGLQDQRVA